MAQHLVGHRDIDEAAVAGALRADQRLENHPEVAPARRAAINQQVLDAFYADTDEWKQRIVEQAFAAWHDALRGLSAGRVWRGFRIGRRREACERLRVNVGNMAGT